MFKIFSKEDERLLMGFFDLYRKHWIKKITQDQNFINLFNEKKQILITHIDEVHNNRVKNLNIVANFFRGLLSTIFGYKEGNYLSFGEEADIFSLRKAVSDTDPTDVNSLHNFFDEENPYGLFSPVREKCGMQAFENFRKETVASVNFNQIFSPSCCKLNYPIDYFFNNSAWQAPCYVASYVLASLLVITIREKIENSVTEKFRQISGDNEINTNISLALQNFFCAWKMATEEQNNKYNFFEESYEKEVKKQRSKSLKGLGLLHELEAIHVPSNPQLEENLKELADNPANFLREFSEMPTDHNLKNEDGVNSSQVCGDKALLSAKISFLKLAMNPLEYKEFIDQVTREATLFATQKMEELLTDTNKNTEEVHYNTSTCEAKENFEVKLATLLSSMDVLKLDEPSNPLFPKTPSSNVKLNPNPNNITDDPNRKNQMLS